MSRPTFSIMTINYNLTEKVLRLWDSLKTHQPSASWEFIVVDNASNQEQLTALQKALANDQNTKVIPLQNNLGYGGGFAEGIKFIEGQFLAIINPDIEMTQNCLDGLSTHLSEEVKIVGPQLINLDGTKQDNARKFPSLYEMLARRTGLEKSSIETSKYPHDVGWLQGSFMLTERAFFTDELEGFDPRFFLFLEDTDLCRSIWAKGYRVQLIPEFNAIHGQERLSGNSLFASLRKKTFWIHVSSTIKYFLKWGLLKPKFPKRKI